MDNDAVPDAVKLPLDDVEASSLNVTEEVADALGVAVAERSKLDDRDSEGVSPLPVDVAVVVTEGDAVAEALRTSLGECDTLLDGVNVHVTVTDELGEPERLWFIENDNEGVGGVIVSLALDDVVTVTLEVREVESDAVGDTVDVPVVLLDLLNDKLRVIDRSLDRLDDPESDVDPLIDDVGSRVPLLVVDNDSLCESVLV